MKVMLVVPTYNYKKSASHFLSVSDFPTGLAYLASAIKKAGHKVIGLNINNHAGYETSYRMMAGKLCEAIEKESPDLIGLGGLCIDYAFIKDAIEVIRRYSKAPIVMGGGIINNDREFIFNLLKPDFCIWGEAEETIVKLINCLEKNEHPHDIDNLAYWTENGAKFNATNHNYGNLDDRAFPDYEPFGIKNMLDNFSMATRVLYRYPRPYPRTMTINTARSCPFNCSFCVHSGGPKYRARSIPNIMAEIKQLYKKYNFNILIMGDELFAANKKRMDGFCKTLIKNKAKYEWDFDWMFQTHANSHLDKESLELAKKAGCFFFSYGIESASPKVLESMNKKTDVEQYIDAIEMAADVGIGFGGNLLFGDPAETDETIRESLYFWGRYCQEVMVFLSMVEPYPGCKIFDYCLQKGIITDKENYYETIGDITYNMTQLSSDDFERWMSLILDLEPRWLFAKPVLADKVELETDNSGPMYHDEIRAYKVYATCPYCGKGNLHRQLWDKRAMIRFIGVGCQGCGKKLRINTVGVA